MSSPAGPKVPLALAAHFAAWGRGVMLLGSGDPDAMDADTRMAIEELGRATAEVIKDTSAYFGADNQLASYVFPFAAPAFGATETASKADAVDTLASAIYFLRRLTDPSVDWLPDAHERAQLLPCAVALQRVLDAYERQSPNPHRRIVAARSGAAVVLRRLLVPPGTTATKAPGFVAVALGAGSP